MSTLRFCGTLRYGQTRQPVHDGNQHAVDRCLAAARGTLPCSSTFAVAAVRVIEARLARLAPVGGSRPAISQKGGGNATTTAPEYPPGASPTQ